ncbi:MAG: helix-hairpin-helix domain-containing protein [Timaviella obliquedivisa GSE-PSE-MK23-08B]|nr:helix-hairpin-helix domain-containing protein [Timaviella obliquedivisa GSE-PSE-MK23-08B]
MSKPVLRALICLLLCFCFVLPYPAWAAPAPERIDLTLELLQRRLKSPTQTEGIRTIDLRRLVIDLRPENAAFRDQFYRLVQAQLQQPGSPLGIDLSYSLIRGELTIRDLGLRTDLFGQTPFPFSEAEQAQLKRDSLRLFQLSNLSRSLLLQSQAAPLQLTVLRGTLTLVQTRFENFANFTNTFFLGRVEAQGVNFGQDVDWSGARFSQTATFMDAVFQREARFPSTIFFNRAIFNEAEFKTNANFQSSEFRAFASFHQSRFQQLANFTRIQWYDKADFSQIRWMGQVLFDRDKFAQALFLTETRFDKLVSFRQTQFNKLVNLRGASILDQADFANAGFAKGAYLNISDLQFDPRSARILGDLGKVGRVLSVPTLQGNETLLRNLVQNFRLQQQISDANQVEYTTERLRLKELRQRLLGVDLNTASVAQLQAVGFSAKQAATIAQTRSQQPFRSIADLLKLEGMLGAYVKVRDRVVVGKPVSVGNWFVEGVNWLGLSLLLLLTRFGTSSWLVLGVGMIAIAHFAFLFWLIDRFRKLHPKPIIPTPEEVVWSISGFGIFSILGFSALFRTAEQPWLTLACLGGVIIPIPALLIGILYGQGRYHDLMDTSYFVEDSSMRQLRFLIGRLPNIPAFPYFRERYIPILWNKSWSWLNYLDFSLNNLLKFGFNDIRLRDEQMPALITALVWYQWGVGLLYFALLLWTLSRTIPGLNLLIYFK